MSTGDERDREQQRPAPDDVRQTPCEQEAFGSLSCPDVTALLYDYMDDVVDPGLRARIEEHLTRGSCECRRALLMELAFDEHIRTCVSGRTAPASLKQRIHELLVR